MLKDIAKEAVPSLLAGPLPDIGVAENAPDTDNPSGYIPKRQASISPVMFLT